MNLSVVACIDCKSTSLVISFCMRNEGHRCLSCMELHNAKKNAFACHDCKGSYDLRKVESRTCDLCSGRVCRECTSKLQKRGICRLFPDGDGFCCNYCVSQQKRERIAELEEELANVKAVEE